MTCRAWCRRWGSSCSAARTRRAPSMEPLSVPLRAAAGRMRLVASRTETEAAIPCDPVNVHEILEHLADAYFYLKDVNSRWRECNSAALTLLNAATKAEVLGKTDWDFYPEQIAREILQDDRA